VPLGSPARCAIEKSRPVPGAFYWIPAQLNSSGTSFISDLSRIACKLNDGEVIGCYFEVAIATRRRCSILLKSGSTGLRR
jgi:hypothetical protein